MLKTRTRKFLAALLETFGWGLIGPAVISGLYFISLILLPQNFTFGVLMVTVMGTLFAAIVVMGFSHNASVEALAYTMGLLFWMFIAVYSVTLTSISISRTTLLIASVVYGAIFVKRLASPTPNTYSE